MKLYSIQTADVVASLKHGVYACDPEKIDPYFRAAYDWLVTQMCQRISPAPAGIQYPIWAWPLQDLDQDYKCGVAEPGTKMVKIELDIPDTELLASDFDDWHHVLNDCFWYSKHLETDAECDSYRANLIAKHNGNEQIAKEASWQNIFTDNPGYHHGCQYTFWVIKPEYITSIEEFIAEAFADEEDSDDESLG